MMFCWVPNHIGIHGNTKFGSIAKQTLQITNYRFKIPYTDLKASIREYVKHLWKTDRNENINNNLHGIRPTASKTQNVILKHRDEVLNSNY
jgi:hypothetical protein